MAKSPSSRKSTKKPAPKKSGKSAKPKAPPAVKSDTRIPAPDDCCTVCDTAATGTWGIPWRDAGGSWHCLIGPTAAGSDKVLRCDNNGPYWGNP